MYKLLRPVVIVVLSMVVSISAQTTLNSLWFSNSGQSGVMFDLEALQPVEITSFQHNLDLGNWDIEIYAHTSAGSYIGNEGSASAWTLIHTESGFAGSGVDMQGASSVLATPYPIAVGNIQAFYVTCTNGAGMNYQYGTGLGNLLASDSALKLFEGHGMCYAFSCFFSPRRYAGAIAYNHVPVQPNDMMLLSIDSPVSSATSCGFPLQDETVTVTFLNMGSNTLVAGTAVPVSFSLDDGTNPPVTVNEVFTPTASLFSFQTRVFSFVSPASLGSAHAWTLTATVSLAGDGDSGNDTASQNLLNGQSNSINSFPWVDNMDSAGPDATTNMPFGWTNSQTDNAGGGSYPDWIARNTPSTPSGGTGPQNGDHTSGSGFYVHVEDSGGASDSHSNIELVSPCIDLTSLSNPQLRFWLCSFNAGTAAQENRLALDIIDWSNGLPVVIQGMLPTYLSQPNQDWYEKSVDLSLFAGKTIQIVFRGTNDNGTFMHDACIDDLRVFEAGTSIGQAAQQGFAELDINGAVNDQGEHVAAYTAGPHFVSVPSGSLANMDITGAPGDQVIILLGGDLNVGVGGVAGVGQFDIGVPSGGVIPNGITVVANGGSGPLGGGFWSSLFRTGSGTMSLSFTYNVPVGLVYPLQAVVFTGHSSVIALSNAVVVTSIL